MANPELIDCLVDTWTKVASNVTMGNVWKKNSLAEYYQTYRTAGADAPTNREDGVVFNDLMIPISAQAGIDVYIYCHGQDGKVRVDL